MASSAAEAPSTGLAALQTTVRHWGFTGFSIIERWLEAEREQLVLWIPVALGAGITAWFLLPGPEQWLAFVGAAAALALVGVAFPAGGRLGRAVIVLALGLALGCSWIWWRADRVAAPVLARPAVVAFDARVERVEHLPARDLVRLRLAPVDRADLPPLVRVNLAETDVPAGLTRGSVVRLRARLMPPPPPAVPGAYDFARVAWFDGIGATGRGFAPVTIVSGGGGGGHDLRTRLSAHIQSRIEGSAGGIASALATGDRGAISDEDSEAMQRSGLAHLLSVSGLHVTAVTAGTMLVVLRLLALSPWLALRLRLPLVAAGAGAAAAIGYTLLTGAEVPTIRSCAAALLVLLALSLGREAITLRLVAAGACFVLLLWPEALAGPSFQLSFAAVTAIVALHENRTVRRWFERREGEGRVRRLARGLASLLMTGIAVELALMPLALFHFHKAGLYGALANIVAIPLTTFVIMPLEALALLLDLVGLGAPIWWLTAQTLNLLLWIARTVSSAPGAVAALPAMTIAAFALCVAGGLWLALWRTRVRLVGAVPLAIGMIWAVMTPPPDLLVTSDGRHLAIRTANGGMALLRDRAGDYMRDILAENGGEQSLALLGEEPAARCSPDVCAIDVAAGARRWRVAATRSAYHLPWTEMSALCAQRDIVISDRRLPRGCTPRWLKLDRAMLARTGGVAIRFSDGHVATVSRGTRHPWLDPPRVMPPRQRTPRRRGD
jgi:competence protein ComEC